MTDRRAGIVIGLILGVAAIVLFVFVLSDDTVDAPSVDETTTEATSTADTDADEPEKEPKEKPAKEKPKPAEPSLLTIKIVGGQPQGGVQEIETAKGEEIEFAVRSDVAEHVHVHGYDLFEDVGPGMTAKFKFTADIEGIFEIELEGSAVPIAELRVNP